MATCQSCRKQFPEEARHCPHCGTARPQLAAEQPKRTVFGYAPSPEQLNAMAQGRQTAGSAAPAALPAAAGPQGTGPMPSWTAQTSASSDATAKTMFAAEVADQTPPPASVRITGSSPPPQASRDAELQLGETLAAPATPLVGPGMLSPADVVSRTAVTETDSEDAALNTAPPAGEVRWGGPFTVFSPGSHAPISGRTLGRFRGQVPDGQEQALQELVLRVVNTALGSSPVPLAEVDLQGDLLNTVNDALARDLPSLGVQGEVAEIKLTIDNGGESAPAPTAQAALATRTSAGEPPTGEADRGELDEDALAELTGAGLQRKVILIAAAAGLAALGIVAYFLFRG